MYEGRRREAWYHTALVASILAEAYRDRDRRRAPYAEADFHPEGRAAYREPDQQTAKPPTPSQSRALEELFPPAR